MWYALVPLFLGLPADGALAKELRPEPELALAVRDHAGIGAKRLARGKERVEFIFRRAGIRVRWWADAVCDKLDPGCFDVLILDQPPASASAGILGFTHERGEGNWLVVVWRKITELAVQRTQEYDADLVLGSTIVHELGHAIMQSRLHGQGVMCERWGTQEWVGSASGRMIFLPEEARRLRQRLMSSGR